ncbi:MAG: FtsX-like permease family protein, partial [Bryobacteraceae bacterium]
AKYIEPDKPARPMFFMPLTQHVAYKESILQEGELRSHIIENVLVVTHMDPGSLEPLLRKTFEEADPNLTIINVRTMQQQVAMNFDQQRAVASLAALFGVVALILAAVGLYGVTAYTVAQRTSEIGVRMALGADRKNVVQLVLRGAFGKVAFGLLLGIPLAVGAGRLMSSQLYGVLDSGPFALSLAILSLAVSAFIAAMIPAARAASIDPIKALRTE